MERKRKVLKASKELIGEGEKISAAKVAQELEWSEEDVHRCLNILEKEGLVETRAKDVLGKKIRMIGVFR
ncbi:hypothetical protein ACK3SF_05305 [Candidatus Nanosalina sp. VS9-1]|uniref:hypothetical protein n=1 Tax=Candidatus Nanosalina sp. VS9-1 TaxID=3388566 RepID=UPI0039E0AF0F